MGMTTGKLSGAVYGNVPIQLEKSGAAPCTANTDANGNYAIYLAAGTYKAYKMPEHILCSPTSIIIPAGTKIQNLSY